MKSYKKSVVGMTFRKFSKYLNKYTLKNPFQTYTARNIRIVSASLSVNYTSTNLIQFIETEQFKRNELRLLT